MAVIVTSISVPICPSGSVQSDDPQIRSRRVIVGVRLLWARGDFGGASVTSARDKATAIRLYITIYKPTTQAMQCEYPYVAMPCMGGFITYTCRYKPPHGGGRLDVVIGLKGSPCEV